MHDSIPNTIIYTTQNWNTELFLWPKSQMALVWADLLVSMSPHFGMQSPSSIHFLFINFFLAERNFHTKISIDIKWLTLIAVFFFPQHKFYLFFWHTPFVLRTTFPVCFAYSVNTFIKKKKKKVCVFHLTSVSRCFGPLLRFISVSLHDVKVAGFSGEFSKEALWFTVYFYCLKRN